MDADTEKKIAEIRENIEGRCWNGMSLDKELYIRKDEVDLLFSALAESEARVEELTPTP